MATVFDNIPEVSFIDNLTLEQEYAYEIADFQTRYKEITGTTLVLPEASPWRILIMVNSSRTYQQALWIDNMGKMNMLKYATGAYLDNYAARFGIARSEGNAATTTVRFTLSAAQQSVIAIPQGTRVSDGNGIYFATNEYAEVAAGETYVDVACTCTEYGSAKNGIETGVLSTLVDRIGYVASVANITASQGGTDAESDDELRLRVYAARAEWNTAGAEDAYKFWVMSYSSLIEDAYIEDGTPGVVKIYVLLEDSELPDSDFLDGLKTYLSEKTRRPLTDNLIAVAAGTVTFNVSFTYYINYSERNQAAAIQKQVAQAVEDYIAWQTGVIGRDIVPDYLVRLVMAAGAKRVVLSSPSFTVVPSGSVPVAGTKTITYGGVEND